MLPHTPHHHYISIYIYRLPSPCLPPKIVSFVLFCIVLGARDICVCVRIERTTSNHIPHSLFVCLLSYWSISPPALPPHSPCIAHPVCRLSPTERFGHHILYIIIAPRTFHRTFTLDWSATSPNILLYPLYVHVIGEIRSILAHPRVDV